MRRWNLQPTREELEKKLHVGPSTPSIHSFMKKNYGNDFIPKVSQDA
jgi:hypothetical protein